jgi:hypothetical protein
VLFFDFVGSTRGDHDIPAGHGHLPEAQVDLSDLRVDNPVKAARSLAKMSQA